METESKTEKAIFDAAMQFESPAERDAYVCAACGDDKKLLAGVRALLKYHDSHSFLDAPVLEPDVTLDDSPIAEGPGTVIGRYKLLEKIGEGGMAVVYMAEQERPIRRKVALKIIKLGMDTKSVIARFEAERQALAMMDHPNIAKVLDAGATDTGRPYFVMELVTGVSITEYCDKNSLSTKQRLALFIRVCNAVQHAHQKGIIHRDIKPSNVMVTHQDGTPVPKVIDFGIAKAINQKLTEKTLFTRYAHIIGTPAYMSPEQADMTDLDVDTRSDIYSLGVLLYELLTGTPPFGEEELRKAGYIEMQRIIREQEPVKPSTRIRTALRSMGVPPMSCGEGILPLFFNIARPGRPRDARARRPRHETPLMGGTPMPLTAETPVPLMGGTPMLREVRGDLDWIVMKTLEKDRARRYETAGGLAEDIRRHLDHEPVLARGPSTTYRLQKLLRRHRSQTIAVLALVIVLGALAVIVSMWNKARLQLTEADEFKDRGILSQAREQYAKADRDAALETIKPILDSRHVGPEAQLLHAGILVDNRRSDEAVAILGNLLDKPQEIAGAAHSLLARILLESESPNAEKLKQIEEHRRQAEALLPETAESHFLQAMFAMTVKEQLAALDEALRLDPDHYESLRLRAFTHYASRKYDKMKDDALGMTYLRRGDPFGCSLRAIALRELGEYAEAIAQYDSAIALTRKEDARYVDLSMQRCETLLRMGSYERVIAEAQECLKLQPDKPVFQYYTFSALTALGDYDKADAVFQQIVGRTPTSRNEFRQWCAKYVFDTLDAGRSWHPPDRERGEGVSPLRGEGILPAIRGRDALDTKEQGQDALATVERPRHPPNHAPIGAAFLPLVEAEETYHALSAKARRLTANGFSAQWSPDGKKLAFSAGVHGYSGVAVYDPATKETELLIVPGKDPRWSPDGKYIAFVRDCQLLRISEFIAAECREQQRLMADEEVWVMKADGTEPRRLARGGWPSWSQDSTCVYYQSRVDNKLCSISIEGQNTEPKPIMTCSNVFPSVSPDNQRVAYLEGALLKIIDLASQKPIAEYAVPSMTWGVSGWSPAGDEVCLGGGNPQKEKTGLWICAVGQSQAAKVLGGQIALGSWSADGTQLAFSLGPPYFEIWVADLDPNITTVEALSPAQTPDEHVREMLALYNRRSEADPQDAYAYSGRAHYYDCLHERDKAKADMRRWSAILSGSDLAMATPRNPARTINCPFNYKIVFSAERPVNQIPLLNVALGQKGRCSMKSFQIPILSTRGLAMSLLGLCLLSGLDAPFAHADFTFGEPVNLKTVFPAIQGTHELMLVDCFSSDGLEMYLTSAERPGGQGSLDIWVSRRATLANDWGPLENLGPLVNSASDDNLACLSADGLMLYFSSTRPGGYGGQDIYAATRTAHNAAWGPAVNLGPKLNTSDWDIDAWISPDGLELYFAAWRTGGYGSADIYVSRRATTNDAWGDPVNLGSAVNTPYFEGQFSLSPDGLLLLFSDDSFNPIRPGGYGGGDMWMSRRTSLTAPWQPAVNLGSIVNGSACDLRPRISPDGRTLYFATLQDITIVPDLWQAPIIPIVDFNGDGVVDIADVGIMLEHWYTDYSLCDIGPFPWGDGFVDAQDLMVLAEYMANNPAEANDVNNIQ